MMGKSLLKIGCFIKLNLGKNLWLFSNTISSDENYSQALEKHWGIPEDESLEISKGEISGAIAKLREKLITTTQGVHDEFKMKTKFKQIDFDNTVICVVIVVEVGFGWAWDFVLQSGSTSLQKICLCYFQPLWQKS